MPKYNVMINLTRTIEASVEIEVSAKDEDAAEEKAKEKVEKAKEEADAKKSLFDLLGMEIASEDDSEEYEVSKA